MNSASKKQLGLMRRGGIFLSIAMLVVALIPVPSYAQAQNCDEEFYSQNDILFYNPCANASCSEIAAVGALTAPGPSALTGETNEEKTWNYFISRGLSAVGAAGAMGNISHESGFRVSAEEYSGGGGFGLIQWTGDRRTKLEAAASAAGVNMSDNDQALLFQLNYLWDGEYGTITWQEPVNGEETVEGDTYKASFNSAFSAQRAETQDGNGSTMQFHALVERSNDVPTEAERRPGSGVLQGRIDKANEFLTQFNGTLVRGSCGSISAGGLSWEQAVAVGKKLVDEWNSIYCGPGKLTTGGNGGEGYCNWDSGYCTAGAAWMVAVTAPDSPQPGIPNGVRVANRLVSELPDLYTSVNADGSNLQPFSVWSFGDGGTDGEPGHTGTIVGIGDNGSIITVETNWAGATPGTTNNFLYNPGHKVAVFEYASFEDFKNSRGSYKLNNIATPKDSSVAQAMAKNMQTWMGDIQ